MEDWEINTTKIIYRGTKQQLPEFLPGFTIPVPRAWFDVFFLARKEKKRTIYTADAYAVTTGYILYDCKAAYTTTVWAEALFTPDQHRQKLEKRRTCGTTQGRFVQFLRSGQFADLEQPVLQSTLYQEEQRWTLAQNG